MAVHGVLLALVQRHLSFYDLFLNWGSLVASFELCKWSNTFYRGNSPSAAQNFRSNVGWHQHEADYQLKNEIFLDGTWKFNWVPCFSFQAPRSIIDHICSTEMDESDLCGGFTQYSLSISAVDGPIYTVLFSPSLLSECFFFSGDSSGYWTLLPSRSHSSFDLSLNLH